MHAKIAERAPRGICTSLINSRFTHAELSVCQFKLNYKKVNLTIRRSKADNVTPRNSKLLMDAFLENTQIPKAAGVFSK
jgi:hypothetical protein